MPTWKNVARRGRNVARRGAAQARHYAPIVAAQVRENTPVVVDFARRHKKELMYAGAGIAGLMALRWLLNATGGRALLTFGGFWKSPLPDGVFKMVSEYGWRWSPTSFLPWPEKHPGIDLSAPAGTPVFASYDGTVVFSGERGDYGNSVVIDHGKGIVTTYNHLAGTLVGKGAQVKKGQQIGTVGSTGRSTGPHLHYEVAKSDNWSSTRNPAGYLPA